MKSRTRQKPSLSVTHAVAEAAERFEQSELSGVQEAIRSAQRWLLDAQKDDGHWVGELEGDTILETEYVLLLQFLGNPDREKLRKLCRYVVERWQNEDGGVPIFAGGPSQVSASVKAYFACKLAGHAADEPFMVRMRECILRLGGVTRCNTFTRLYLAIFGQYDWDGVPTIPPELSLLPRWFYLNLYEMSSWSRAILVPLAIINACRPNRPIPADASIDELYVSGRRGPGRGLPWDRRPITMRNAFLVADRALKLYDRSPVKPLRRRAIRVSEAWMRHRQRGSGGLGAIFPAMTHAVMAYKCLGYPDDHPALAHEVNELARFEVEEGDTIRLQPCLSPVWDTAIALNALLDSGLSRAHPAIARGVEWLLAKQTTTRGDWAAKASHAAPGGWFFEYENHHYPDVDDSVMVLMALYKAHCADGEHWTTAPPRVREAMRRGLDWVFAMQNRNGGWASFDKDNEKMVFQHVPYADHNAMLDPATADITARTLEMASYYSILATDRRVARALRFIYRDQEADGSWFGRWGVNYLYGTWQVLRGLARIGEDVRSSAVRRAVRWLESVQNEDGGWGETCRSYENPALFKARGPSTASQTAWALMGLVNTGDHETAAARLGVQYLLRTQLPNGSWDEPWFTGTGFPQVFYLRYHLYSHYFPLWALGQYAAAISGAPTPYGVPEHLID
ncbi:MAG: squalene--hopene cyclase [Chthonomonadales bacterium]|nr:squalene--hopene cyclase [Chthonomonadales bacterium]